MKIFPYIRFNVVLWAICVCVFGVCIQKVHAQVLTAAQRAELQAELNQVEAEAAQAEEQLTKAQGESASLSRDIAVLNAKIKAATLDIKAKNLLIQTLGQDINDKQKHIDALQVRIEQGKDTLSDLLRRTNEADQYSLSQILLSRKSVTGFFNDIDTFQAVQTGLAAAFAELRGDTAATQAEKDALDKRRNTEMDARHTIQVLQANIEADKKQQAQLLAISKGNEKSYNNLLAQKKSRAGEIRSALFALNGAQAIPFGDALNYANIVYQKTGVSQAFLLAVLTQETNLGKNVGVCFLTDTNTGSGINTRTQAAVYNVMKPGRDIQPFLEVTNALGLDYKTMPVSCPQSIGFGGAMGPAQFIASTWTLPSIKDRVMQLLGTNTMPNPWKPLDAFTAAGLYLSDLGAATASYSSQRNAACRYYSGSSCKSSNGSSGYGNNVMALADSIQRNMINPLQGL